jgi:hypothetical protein
MEGGNIERKTRVLEKDWLSVPFSDLQEEDSSQQRVFWGKWVRSE